jgi:hypothetical protein
MRVERRCTNLCVTPIWQWLNKKRGNNRLGGSGISLEIKNKIGIIYGVFLLKNDYIRHY